MQASMVKPIHPGTVLRDCVLHGLDLTVIQAARELHICRQTLHRILAGSAAVTPDMAARLARLSGVPASFWLDLQQAHDLAHAEANLAEILPRIPTHVLPPAIAKELTSYGR